MADERIRQPVKITDPTTDANEAGVDASGNLQVILAANTGVDIGDVDVLSVIPGVGVTNLGKAEDQASADGDVGVAAMVVQDAVLTALGSADLDYTNLRVNANGALWTQDVGVDAALAGSELQVDIVAELPAGTQTIGNVGGDEVDNAAVSVGGSVLMNGLVFDDTTPVVVTEGDAGYQRMSADREAYIINRDAAGNERGANVTASNELNVLASAQPGIDIGDVDVLSVIPGVGATNLGKAENAASAGADTIIPTAAVQDAVLSALGSVDGDYTQVRVNANGALWVEDVSAGGGGTAEVDDATFTTGTDSYTPMGGILDETAPNNLEENDGGVVRMTANRAMHTAIRDGAGNERSANVDASNNLQVIAGANSGVDIGDVDVLSLPTSPDTLAEDTAFAAAAAVFPMGAQFDDAAPNVIDEGDIGAPRCSVNRNLYTTIRDHTAERGVEISAANEMLVILEDTAVVGTDGAAGPAGAISVGGTESGGNFQELRTDADGHLQIDVLTGGGSDTPAGEARAHTSSTDTAAAATFDADSADFGTATKKLSGVDAWASVPIKVTIMSVSDNAETIIDVVGARAGEMIQWRPPHRDYYEVAFTANAGFDGFRAEITNLDNSQAADLYGTIYSED